MDLVEAYGVRTIEGIDKNDFLSALPRRGLFSDRYEVAKDTMLSGTRGIVLQDKVTGSTVMVECIAKYFEPVKRYYRIGQNDSCEMIQRALGINEGEYSELQCQHCFSQCISQGAKLKPATRRVIRNKIT